MLLSAPDEVARTNAMTFAPSATSASGRCGRGRRPRARCAARRARSPTRWGYRRRASMQGNPSRGRGAVHSGLLTGVSTAAVSGSAAVAGVILSRKFGHGVKTDGFFAAYGVYLALILVAGSLRVVVLPRFAAARVSGRL